MLAGDLMVLLQAKLKFIFEAGEPEYEDNLLRLIRCI